MKHETRDNAGELSECSSTYRYLWMLHSSEGMCCCCQSCSSAGKHYVTNCWKANTILLQPWRGQIHISRPFPCIVLWNWITTRPQLCDRKDKMLLYTLAAFSVEACCDTHEAAAQGTELVCGVFFYRSCFLPLESDVLGWAADSSKHHCLKTCGCFTFVKRKCGSATYIDYTSQLEFGVFLLFRIFIYSP